MPELYDNVVQKISARYIKLYEKFTSEKFEKSTDQNHLEPILQNIKLSVSELY